MVLSDPCVRTILLFVSSGFGVVLLNGVVGELTAGRGISFIDGDVFLAEVVLRLGLVPNLKGRLVYSFTKGDRFVELFVVLVSNESCLLLLSRGFA